MSFDVSQWPAGLAVPLMGRSHDFDPKSKRTAMDSGRVRNRRMTDTVQEILKATWNFTEDEYHQFEDYFIDTLENGTLHFELITLDFTDDQAVLEEVHRELAFVDNRYNFSRSDNVYSVSAQLEVVNTEIFTTENPKNLPPELPVEYPVTLDEFGFPHVCRDTFKITFPTKIGIQYIVQIGESPYLASAWADHIFWTGNVDGTKTMELNNDYPRQDPPNADKALLYFRVVKIMTSSRGQIYTVTVAAPVRPLPSVIKAPEIAINNLTVSTHPMWSSGTTPSYVLAYSRLENALINPSDVYYVPRKRLEWNRGTDGWDNRVHKPVFYPYFQPRSGANLITFEAQANTDTRYTRDGTDPKVDTYMPVLDGWPNETHPSTYSASILRDDFGMMVKARSFSGFCKSPVSVILVDKKIWVYPDQFPYAFGTSRSYSCDHPRVDHIRTKWERDDKGKFINGLTEITALSGQDCSFRPEVGLTAGAVPVSDRDIIIDFGGSVTIGSTISIFGTGDGGTYQIGFNYEFNEGYVVWITNLVDHLWTFARPLGKWDRIPAVFSNVYFEIGPTTVGLYPPTIEFRANNHPAWGGSAYRPLPWVGFTICGPTGRSDVLAAIISYDAVPISQEMLGRLESGDLAWPLKYDVWVILTVHDDYAPPNVPHAAIIPVLPPDPPVPPLDVDPFDSYPDLDVSTVSLNGGDGFDGAWSFSISAFVVGEEDFQTYDNAVIEDGDTSLTRGEGFTGSWSFSFGTLTAVYLDDFQTYEDGEVRINNGGTGWDEEWTVSNSHQTDGLEDWQAYPDGTVDGTEDAGINYSLVAWSITDSAGTVSLDNLQSYSDGPTTGTENGGTGWGSAWSFN